MAYSELIKNFDKIREYMRAFYVYGYKSRDEYDAKSVRSYDNERRRIESYLGDYMGFRWTPGGKNVFLSIDSREIAHNPLYKALKAKSFTDGDITMHFILMDLLADGDWHSLKNIMEGVDAEYLSCFDSITLLDESTVRKKLKEYLALGLLEARKEGKTICYRRMQNRPSEDWVDAAAFFSEAGMLGVVGSYILDMLPDQPVRFSFKHHYITGAIDSEVLCVLLYAISRKCRVSFSNVSRAKSSAEHEVIPLMIFHGAQNGRQHLLGYEPARHDFVSYRVDYMNNPLVTEQESEWDAYRVQLEQMRKHMWGVVCSRKKTLEHVEFCVRFGDSEMHIPRRLEREKRCGSVTLVDSHTCRFSADVYDTFEMLPWIRTFIGRITDLKLDNRAVEERLMNDLDEMCAMYGLEEGD